MLDAGKSIEHKLEEGRYAWVQVTRGAVNVGGNELKAGDGAALSKENVVQLSGAKDGGGLTTILRELEESGFISYASAASHGPMYGHGFATMFLAECYGMSPRPELREKLTHAVQLIVDTQNSEGGWRYQPTREQAADISVTVCEVMALRAARNAGLHIPKDTIEHAITYIKKSQTYFDINT